MTQYANPDLTQREIVENNILAIETMPEQVDETAAAATAHLDGPVDFPTAQFIGQHVSMQNGAKFQLNSELTRLKNIIATWDGTPLAPPGTPTLTLTPMS
ncbi:MULTISPECIES: hypothetical protein [Sphingomonadaceae]|uniref:Uncharacterized protein n=1 Tax=Sphingomonas bisphenolicum TaxID=296544 RepID=A0ABN5WFL7_9SPHN|nr:MULTISPECIES: hypothetical protein [Sphingomonadaceae]KAA9009591.1 hypothetical protein F4U94_23110 [Sphingobium limneticum]BBC99480.1 hypothetical protein YGS_C1P0736 [Sphingobium sp. YG1]BBF70638.1 hypothetical protein SBA_ch1_28380 [Sphingomonas bisphenolicum]